MITATSTSEIGNRATIEEDFEQFSQLLTYFYPSGVETTLERFFATRDHTLKNQKEISYLDIAVKHTHPTNRVGATEYLLALTPPLRLSDNTKTEVCRFLLEKQDIKLVMFLLTKGLTSPPNDLVQLGFNNRINDVRFWLYCKQQELNFDIKTLNGDSILHRLTDFARNDELLKILITCDEKHINSINQNQHTPLMIAIETGMVLVVQELFNLKPDLEINDKFGQNFLHYLGRTQYIYGTEKLCETIEKHLNPQSDIKKRLFCKKDDKGSTPVNFIMGRPKLQPLVMLNQILVFGEEFWKCTDLFEYHRRLEKSIQQSPKKHIEFFIARKDLAKTIYQSIKIKFADCCIDRNFIREIIDDIFFINDKLF